MTVQTNPEYLTTEHFFNLEALSRNYPAVGKPPAAMDDSKFWHFLVDSFGTVPLGSNPANGKEFLPLHPFYESHQKADRETAIRLLQQYGFVFNGKNMCLSPVQSSDVIPTIDTEIRDWITGTTRRIHSDSEVVHIGSVDQGEISRYDNREALRTQGVWGNPNIWTYVGADIFSIGTYHKINLAMLYVDRDTLFEMRTLFVDPEGIDHHTEFGRAFMFKGGIPKEAIKKVEVIPVERSFPDVINPIATMSLEGFLSSPSPH